MRPASLPSVSSAVSTVKTGVGRPSAAAERPEALAQATASKLPGGGRIGSGLAPRTSRRCAMASSSLANGAAPWRGPAGLIPASRSAAKATEGARCHEARRVRAHQPEAVSGRPGLRLLDAARLGACGPAAHRGHQPHRLPVLPAPRGPELPDRRPEAGLAQRRSAVVHAAALPAARADGLRGPGRAGRPGRVRRRRHLGAADPRHGRQGHHVPAPSAEEDRARRLGHQRHAARLRQAAATGAPRKASTSCSRSSATISTGSSCSSRTRTRSGRSRTSGTISTG